MKIYNSDDEEKKLNFLNVVSPLYVYLFMYVYTSTFVFYRKNFTICIRKLSYRRLLLLITITTVYLR